MRRAMTPELAARAIVAQASPDRAEAAERLLDGFTERRAPLQETLFPAMSDFSLLPLAGQSQPLPRDPLQATFQIAGVPHRCGQDLLNRFREGDRVEFVREPLNQYDSNAVQIVRGYRHIGYAPRDLAKQLAPLIDAGWAVKAMIDQVKTGTEPRFWVVRCVFRCWPAAGEEVSA